MMIKIASFVFFPVTLFLFAPCISFIGKPSAVAGIASGNTLSVKEVRQLALPDANSYYQTPDGGSWRFDPADDSSADNEGTVLVSASGARFKRIYDTAKGVNIEWFGGKGDGKTDNGPAFAKAKAALPNGGIINFGVGTYTSQQTWLVNKSDLFMRGAGADKTILTADSTVKRLFDICTIREAEDKFIQGLRGDASQLFPYKNKVRKGDNFIELKDDAWAKEFPVGQEIFIRAGAHYYDQEFGELNEVINKEGGKLYLKYPLSRDYSYEGENWEGTLLENFTPPPAGKTAVATIKIPPRRRMAPFSIGNDIYTLIGVKGNEVTVLNPGRENGSSVIPAGTHVTKGRQIIKSFHTRNFRMEGITLKGQQARVFTADNSMHTLIRNCTITRDIPNNNEGGYNFTVDCARDVTFENVSFISPDYTPRGGQISRSSGDIVFKHCRFVNAPTDFSEFCFNTWVDSSTYDIKKSQYATRLGKSTTYCKITNSTITMQGGMVAVSMDDIQAVKMSQREGSQVYNCIFQLRNVGSVVQNMGRGINEFIDNKIEGNFSILCNSLRIKNDGDKSSVPTQLYFKNNIVKANVNSFLFNAGNGQIVNNTFEYVGTPSSYPLAGLVVRRSPNFSEQMLNNLVIKNNTFINWPKKDKPIQVNEAGNKSAITITDNKFLNR